MLNIVEDSVSGGKQQVGWWEEENHRNMRRRRNSVVKGIQGKVRYLHMFLRVISSADLAQPSSQQMELYSFHRNGLLW